jgi:ferritin-like protein
VNLRRLEMAAKVTLELSIKDFKSMADYLERHEGDIAHDFDDFWDIKGLYEAVFEEEPKKD